MFPLGQLWIGTCTCQIFHQKSAHTISMKRNIYLKNDGKRSNKKERKCITDSEGLIQHHASIIIVP